MYTQNKRLYDNTLVSNIFNKKFKYNNMFDLDNSFDTEINLIKTININDSKINESKINESKINESKINESKINDSNINESNMNETNMNETNMNETNDSKKIEENNVYNNYLNKIVILLENIDSRIEKCEKNISSILNIQNNIIDEKNKKKKYQDEILKSYTS
jgi:hypothetical protein